MTEDQFPVEEPDAVRHDGILADQGQGAAGRGREEPLLQDDTVSGEEEDFLSEQTPHVEKQQGTDAPTLEEAAAATDPGKAPTGEEPGPGDDQSDLGSPLSLFDPDDLER
ncbi:hypothetical protein [Arthrobacter sp. AFG20]|uniref:hypothetical protein n=1 Tax=Arthrobacter sp. AFG20 TaxID=1688671 RepID=UPI000C9E61BF|nr:hypothetical protein [Arthrobacter sp. AFG20]PNH85931.1 hypothetical protein CXZ05_02095 [Arthrobacter sp. AFG20]